MYNFIDKYGYGTPYTNIHPFKQKAVKHMLDNKPPSIQVVIIFGSSVLPSCKDYSDIDVCLIGDFEEFNLSDITVEGQAYDFVKYETVEELQEKAKLNGNGIDRDIYNKGVVVYNAS